MHIDEVHVIFSSKDNFGEIKEVIKINEITEQIKKKNLFICLDPSIINNITPESPINIGDSGACHIIFRISLITETNPPLRHMHNYYQRLRIKENEKRCRNNAIRKLPINMEFLPVHASLRLLMK